VQFLVECSECISHCGVLSDTHRSFVVYLKPLRSKLLLFLSHRREENFRKKISTVEPPYSRIRYPRFQLSAVYCGPKILTHSLPKSTMVDFSIYVLICQRRL
jgi:hypothetical protein